MERPLIYLSATDIRRALPMPDAINAMREAFCLLAREQVVLPLRQCLDAADQHGVALVMPCHSSERKLISVKIITLFDNNVSLGLPLIQSLVVLTDGTTGEHVAIMEGASLTALRTGAVSGVATDLLARPDAETVAIFGAGVQARTQLEAVCCVRDIRAARVFDLDLSAAERFADVMTCQLGIPVQSSSNAVAALKDADIVCTATSAKAPVFDDSDIRPGTHINGVGSYRLDMTEIPPATVCRARVVVDHLISALEEAGDLVNPMRDGLFEQAHFGTELGDLLLERSPGRVGADEVTFFKSVGVAVQDLCAAAAALDNARDLGLGLTLPRG